MGELYFPFRQSVLIILCGCLLLGTVINLIRKRKLLEQYGILWIGIGILSLFAFWLYPALLWFTDFIGAGSTTSALLFAAVFVLLLISIQLSIKISEYAFKIKDIVQQLAILQHEVQDLRAQLKPLETPPAIKPIHPENEITVTSISEEP